MISVEEAQAMVAAAFRPLAPEVVGLQEAHGRVLATDVFARLSQPPADLSAMDGWACRSADLGQIPATLRAIGVSAAGAGFAGMVGPGETVRIFTGARVPAGADTIVVQEHAEASGDGVRMDEAPAPGRHIRRAGQDFREGDLVLRAGGMLGAGEIGLAAAANVPWLAVRRRPRVAILCTGDELVLPGEPRGPDQIVEAAGFACAALLRELGAEPIFLGIARDDEASLAAMLAAARGCDLLLTIGGVSVGDFDLVRRLVEGSAVDFGFHKVAMRPGKPLLFGRLAELPVLGLPGNPASAFVTLMVIGRVAIDTMLGRPGAGAPASARLGRALPANDSRQDYLRATLEIDAAGEMHATPFEVQDSAMLRTLAAAGCLVVRPPAAPAAAAGSRVSIVPLSGGSAGSPPLHPDSAKGLTPGRN